MEWPFLTPFLVPEGQIPHFQTCRNLMEILSCRSKVGGRTLTWNLCPERGTDIALVLPICLEQSSCHLGYEEFWISVLWHYPRFCCLLGFIVSTEAHQTWHVCNKLCWTQWTSVSQHTVVSLENFSAFSVLIRTVFLCQAVHGRLAAPLWMR